MDILLTHGYFLWDDPLEQQVMRPYPPLGILYISAYLKAQGFDAKVFDSTFSTFDQFKQTIERDRPPVVGIYTNMMTRRNVLKMVEICKANGCLVILGGPDPANYAQTYLAHGVDIVVIGEGEVTLQELLPHLGQHGPIAMDHIPGIVYREDEQSIIRTTPRSYVEDLNTLPFPDRSAIDIQLYMQTWKEHHGQHAVSLITARGCPYKCNWCSHAVYGYTHRRRSPINVADEVEQIRATYNPDLLWYADDVFTINHRWLSEYAAELSRRGLNTPFETISREDRLNEKVVKTLADMGCYRLWIGAESGSQRILDTMERQTNVQRVIEMIHLLKKYHIETGMFIMLGYDGEEIVDLEATVQTLKAANPDIFLTTLAYPIAGTKYHQKVAERIIPLQQWHKGSDRDHTVRGRYSRRFYQHATRWIVGEVAFHQQLQNGNRHYHRMAKAYLNAKIGRLGMALTKHQTEQGQ